MNKLSVRKLSVLGLVLMAASAVTAAVLPASSNDLKQVNSADDGTRQSQSGLGGGGGAFSCIVDPQPEANNSCNISASVTGAASELAGAVTFANTSDSNPANTRDSTSKPDVLE